MMIVYACQCLNPNSGDTGGILDDDWTTPKADKLGILHDIQPQPSRITRAEDGSFRYVSWLRAHRRACRVCWVDVCVPA